MCMTRQVQNNFRQEARLQGLEGLKVMEVGRFAINIGCMNFLEPKAVQPSLASFFRNVSTCTCR